MRRSGTRKGQWLKNGSTIVVELAKIEDSSDDSLELVKEKTYGDNKLLIMK